MIQSFLKICNIGFGPSHVVANNGVRAISRWGFWTKPLTVLISRIHPIDHDKQFANTHETNFVSFIFKGNYTEEINDNGKIIVKKRKWFNYVKKSTFHRIKCDEYVWSIQAGFFRDDKVMVKINNRIYPHKRLFTMGGRDDGTLG